MMAWAEDEAIGPDVALAGLHVSERIGRDAAAQPDLEEALEASRYASHPYSSHPKEVTPAPPPAYFLLGLSHGCSLDYDMDMKAFVLVPNITY
ncbi:hypothetical protein D1007_25047 [Hordeum vulgare]|nr:hypothetical protein D1007_25047 [Hordeum vulgare]